MKCCRQRADFFAELYYTYAGDAGFARFFALNTPVAYYVVSLAYPFYMQGINEGRRFYFDYLPSDRRACGENKTAGAAVT